MTAVVSPVRLSQPSRTGWNSVNGSQNGINSMGQEDVGKIYNAGPRKTATRSNSSSSINTTSSSSSTISASSAHSNGSIVGTGDNWAGRKKPTRGLWPPGKSEPTSGLSTARPQSVSSASSGPSAASAISALHAPQPPQQQTANITMQQNGVVRNGAPTEGSAFLFLLPMNATFEKKTIHVPYYPDVLRIGRQTNAKTAPTPGNGFFDSKVLSRQHAEVYAERGGRIFIRDIKSSNGTFVNGKRLSPENKESEPHELREQDVLELGIDIVSEDQKTVVHHKVAARVEHAGVYSQNGEIGFGDIDPSGGNTFMSTQQMKRGGPHPGMPGMKPGAPINGPGPVVRDPNAIQQQQWSRMFLQPISTEQIVKRLNRELKLAKQQAQDIARAKQTIDNLTKGVLPTEHLDEKREDKVAASPMKASMDANHFPEPPAPPPQQPLPEKPDVSKSLNDPVIQPLLQRSDTARPNLLDAAASDPSQALFVLSHELKIAKDQIPSLQDRVRMLEQQLREERTARVSAEERAYQLEHGPRKDSAEPLGAIEGKEGEEDDGRRDTMTGLTEDIPPIPDLQTQIERLQGTMADMKQQMEDYRRKAELAESERDQVRQTLAEMIEEKRVHMTDEGNLGLKLSKTRSREPVDRMLEDMSDANGHTIRPFNARPMAIKALLEKAGVDSGKPITRQQAVSLQQVLRKEMLGPEESFEPVPWQQLSYHGIPHACALTTVILGLALMRYLNGVEKVHR